MENIILEFDKRIVSKEEMKEHVKYYSDKADEAMTLYSSGDIKGARAIFKELRKSLQLEYKYYDKVSVNKYIMKNTMYITYVSGIKEAYAKQMNPNSNDMLYYNLYDIHDYTSNYNMRIFLEDK